MALTSGFACFVACDCNGQGGPSADTMTRFAEASQATRDGVCDVLPKPFQDGWFIEGVTTTEQLAAKAKGLLQKPCKCT